MKRFSAISVLLVLCTCELNPRTEPLVDAARRFSALYAKHDVHAAAAGDDCLVLLIRAETRLGDASVESIYYGTGEIAGYGGGVRQFLEDHGFRAVVYRDSEHGLWTYGSVTSDEARSLRPCR